MTWQLHGKWLHGLVFVVSMLLAACQLIFGDFKSGKVNASVAMGDGHGGLAGTNGNGSAHYASGGLTGVSRIGASGGSADPKSAVAGSVSSRFPLPCESEGVFRCTATSLEICQNHRWQHELVCDESLCDATRGRCMSCAPGTNRCVAWSLQSCPASGDGWTLVADCDTAAYCDSVSKSCHACLAGETFCSGSRLYLCKQDQSGWTVTDCQNANLCNARIGSCRPCVRDEYQCNAESLQFCNSDQEWVQLDLCASPELCQQSLSVRADAPADWGKKCQPPRCRAGDFRCDPMNKATLQGCPPSGLDWDVVETCLTPALCNPVTKHCDKGCVPGNYLCAGARLELCRQDGTGFDDIITCEDANHCNIERHNCDSCVPGEYHCSGEILMSCGTDFAWQTQQVCASAALCDAKNAQCISKGCPKANAFSCDGADLRNCPPDLVNWTKVASCASEMLCDAANGRCNLPQCPTPAALRCQGNVRERCDEKTRAWTVLNSCSTGQICDLTSSSGCLGTCPAITTRCNTTGAQTDVEYCVVTNNAPEWRYAASCATSALCIIAGSVAECNAPVCNINQYQCTGNELQRCNAGRTGWDPVKACTSGQICDANGAQCDNCVASSFTCSLTRLTQCSSDGQINATIEDCGNLAHCYVTADKLAGYCYRCDKGNARCVGAEQIQDCAPDRRNWNSATSCANGCQDNAGDADYCAGCAVAGETQCAQVSSPGSTRSCPSNRRDWSASSVCSEGYGCVDSGGSDYCAGACAPNVTACAGMVGLHTCSGDGKGWSTTVSQCADTSSLKACVNGMFSGTSACPLSAPFCVAGQCVTCIGSTTECAGPKTSRRCNAGSWVSTPCADSTPECSAGSCVACTGASNPTCVGSNTRQYCSGTRWATGMCSGSTPFCQNGNCVACISSSTSSCVDTNTVQFCAGSDWGYTKCTMPNPNCFGGTCKPCNSETPPDCLDETTRRYCSAGAFATASCSVAGSTACLNGACVGCNASSMPNCSSSVTLSRCSASGTWIESVCPVETPICAGNPGACVQCAPDSKWACSDSTTRHACTDSKLVVQPCTAGKVCDPGDATCKSPNCAVGQYQCLGSTLQKCNAGRSGWDSIAICEAGQLCDAGAGACRTPVCDIGQYQCLANALRICNADRSGWNSLLVCSDDELCDAARAVCSPVACAAGQYRCIDTALQACDSGRTGWYSVESCAGTTPICDATRGLCVACMVSSDCSGTTPICTTGGCTGCTSSAVCSSGKTCQPDGSCLVAGVVPS